MDAKFDYKRASYQFKIIPILRLDHEAIDLLGLRRDIEWYLDALEFRRFIEISHLTYEKLNLWVFKHSDISLSRQQGCEG